MKSPAYETVPSANSSAGHSSCESVMSLMRSASTALNPPSGTPPPPDTLLNAKNKDLGQFVRENAVNSMGLGLKGTN